MAAIERIQFAAGWVDGLAMQTFEDRGMSQEQTAQFAAKTELDMGYSMTRVGKPTEIDRKGCGFGGKPCGTDRDREHAFSPCASRGEWSVCDYLLPVGLISVSGGVIVCPRDLRATVG